MILYTPLSYQEIFPEEQEAGNGIQAIEWQGRTVFVSKNNDGNYQINQLISSNPNDYLNPDFLPGRIIS
ncbi:YlzJ-like family protein [Oceanobacillus sojae]|uniref:YlzJ-like family protein n=1 Tax=Oceanobacillus sojae TaxID=582851 RepID=UPI0009885422|nr:YlzJ-like family protein [Oceanobacillus sojae]MCT1903804.1 YlzJ-like family protein [Oceanobacillus sojae]